MDADGRAKIPELSHVAFMFLLLLLLCHCLCVSVTKLPVSVLVSIEQTRGSKHM